MDLYIDPYLDRRIRLAERKQLLVGNNLNQVQEFALELCMLSDEREKSELSIERFKLAMVSHDPKLIPAMYPDWVKQAEQEKVKVEATEADLIDTTGEWEFSDSISPEDAENIINEILGTPTVNFTSQELGNASEEGWI